MLGPFPLLPFELDLLTVLTASWSKPRVEMVPLGELPRVVYDKSWTYVLNYGLQK